MNKNKGGYISVNQSDRIKSIKEDFKGMSADEPNAFPRGLGAKHPFDFESIEKLYCKYGVVAETVNKIANSIVGDFEVKVENDNAQAILDDFIKDTNFHTVIDAWVREAVLKGNGFVELDLDNTRIRVLNAKYMYVKRNKRGKVLEYNQWTKPLKNFDKDAPDLVPFKPEQIAHITINKIPNDPYGIGLIYPNERIIENLVLNEQDLQVLVTRKAGAPYHVKVGQPGQVTPTAVVDSVNSSLQYLNNSHNWTTDADVEIKEIKFEGLTNNLTQAQDYWFKKFVAGTGVPEVYFGSGELNEGIAKVQESAYKRKIAGYQTHIAQVIEEKIIKPLLNANGFDLRPEFIWELPTEDDINLRIDKLQALISSIMINPMLKAQCEIELAKLLGFKDLSDKLPSPEEAQIEADRKREEELRLEPSPEAPINKNKERETEENIPQPEVPGAKKNARQELEILDLQNKYNQRIYIGELIK